MTSTIFLFCDEKGENYQLSDSDFYENDYMNSIALYYDNLPKDVQDKAFEMLCKRDGVVKLGERHIRLDTVKWFASRADRIRENASDFIKALSEAESKVALGANESEVVSSIKDAVDGKFRSLRIAVDDTIDDYVYYCGCCYTLDSFIARRHGKEFYVCGAVACHF